MDNSKVKLCSSLQWLSGFVQTSAPTETVRQLLLNPYGDYGCLSDKVVTLLTNPSLYLGIYKAVFPNEEALEPGTFWPLIQRLAKRGVYILENNEVAVNHSVLAQTNPFRDASHLALIDGLMTAHATSVVTVGRIVKAVRRISTFNPSQELPCGVEDSLLLWLNKVSEAVCRNHKEQLSEMLQDPNARQRRRNRLKMVSESEPSIPLIGNLCTGIRDGQCLAALLVHYFPEMVRWSDFCFSNKMLPEAQCLHNLKKVREFCSSHLSSPAFHLNPEDLLAFSQSSLLKTNILALLAHLFWSFEVKSPTCGETTAAAQNGVNRQGNLASKQSLFKKDHSKRNVPPSRCSLSSYSLNDLPSQTQLDTKKTVVPSLCRHRLSSYSASALLENTHTHNRGQELNSGSTVFNAPIRSSLTAPQAAALAGFKYSSEKAKELITASTENLHIREQMLSERRNWGRGHPVCYAASLNSSGGSSSKSSEELSTSGGADVSGNCTESWPATNVMSTNPGLSSKPPQTLGGKSSEIPPQLCSNTPPKSSQFYTNLQNEDEVRRSITLNKHHTVASASAAGLPIIISHLDDTPDQDEGARATNPVALKASNLTTAIAMPPPDEVPQQGSREVSSSTSSTSSTPTVVHLRLHPQATEGKSLVDSASIPSEIVELRRQLRCKEVDIRRQQAILEKELEGERQKFHQRVFFAIMQGTRENKTPAISLEDEHSKPQPVSGTTQEDSQTVASHSSSTTFLKPAAAAGYPPPHKHLRIGPLSENGVGKETTPSWTNHCSTRKKPPHVTLRHLEQLPFSPILPISNASEGPPTSLEPHNPWADPLQQDGKHSEVPVMTVSHEDALRRREQQVRARMEEREKARKTGAEQRRKEQLMSAIHEQTGKPLPSLETSEDTIHFKLSDQQAAAAAGPSMATYLSHNGPECYTRPKTKSNKKIIRNAVCHVCLAGEANVSAKQRALAELDASTASHYLVLFRYTIGFKFRALYSFVPETDQISKVFGNGPRVIKNHMISHLYKYNSGAKEFKEILTKSFSISVDALTIKNDYWMCKKTKPPSGAFR